jgi:threonine dehydratase
MTATLIVRTPEPTLPSLLELEARWRAAADIVCPTPVFSSRSLSDRCGGDIRVKAENLQRTGSFKLRGALSKLGTLDPGCQEVVTGSAGNHAQALAYAARTRGLECTVYMPAGASLAKISAVQAFGAQVREGGESVDRCIELARDHASARGATFVHPFDDIEVIKGQAGVGLELCEQVPDLAKVVIPVGGGGLASGTAMAIRRLRPGVEIVGVQARVCARVGAREADGRGRGRDGDGRAPGGRHDARAARYDGRHPVRWQRRCGCSGWRHRPARDGG